jgi:tetratricopeptide (TPR) repeat protein
MSSTLNIADHLLVRGRNLQQLGRSHDAARVFGRLAGLRVLPADVAEETQCRLAELLLQRGKNREARRHLRAALVLQPNSARYHYLIAMSLDDEDAGDAARALEHYEKSLEADPQQPRCLAGAGLVAILLGKTEHGLSYLRRAVELDPANPEMVRTLVDALCELGRTADARRTLMAALFRNPRDRRFRREWDDFRFHRVHEEQKARQRRDVASERGEESPTLLPFVRPASGSRPSPAGNTIRRHGSAPAPGPHLPSFGHVPDRKHA